MALIVFFILAVVCALLDLASFVAFVVGIVTFFGLDQLKPFRWWLIGGGLVGTLAFLPLADFFLHKVVKALGAV